MTLPAGHGLRGARIVRPDGIADAARRLLGDGWRLALLAAHEDPGGYHLTYTFVRPVSERTEIVVPLPQSDAEVPSLAALSYPASRFEREAHDLFGVRFTDHPLPRRLVRHSNWPAGWHPGLRSAPEHPPFVSGAEPYPFVPVEGDGVYEIPVGPVHAGMIEPGHFRFSVVGETVLRLKIRLWFLHRGVERLFQGQRPADGMALAERISGDTAIGHSLAYCLAVEEALGVRVSERVALMRALLLELERLHCHIADLGAIVNDVGFGIAQIHATRLREQLLRHNKSVTGHRLLRGCIGIGSAQLRGDPDLALVDAVATEVAELVRIALDHAIVADRLTGTAILSGQQAAEIGALGYVARASGISIDARTDQPMVSLEGFSPALREAGDVRSRFEVRAEEFATSAQLVGQLTQRLQHACDDGATMASRLSPAMPAERCAGLGVVEAWRGMLCHRVELADDGTLRRVKVVDPSFFNWPGLPLAMKDTIVPDFPLANKSFNQSYAGNDL